MPQPTPQDTHNASGASTRAPDAINVAFYPCLNDTVAEVTSVTWEQLAEELGQFTERQAKDGRLWSPVTFKDDKPARRANDNIDTVNAFTFDYDHQEPPWSLLEGLEYRAHTTHTHHANNPKCGRPDCPHWRVVVRITKPIAANDYPEAWRRLVFWLAPEADQSCKDESRGNYLPSCLPGAPRETKSGEGAPVDWTALHPVPDEPVEKPSPARTATAAPSTDERPGDRFNREATWNEILEPTGARSIARLSDGSQRWCRPGKKGATSATTDGGGSHVLYVFTDGWAPFTPRTSYTRFRAYALLNHNGDDKAAARALAERYGMNERRGPTVIVDENTFFSPPGKERTNGHAPAKAASNSEPQAVHRPAPAGLQALLASLSHRIDAPLIDAGNLDLRVVTTQAWDAIAQANGERPFLFKHGGVPVWVGRDDDGRATIGELTQAHIRHILARVAMFYVVKIKKTVDDEGEEHQTKSRKVTLPPTHVCTDVLATPDPDLPVIVRLIDCPVFAPDGTLQTEPGYHAAGRVYLAIAPGLTVPSVPDNPTPADITRARALIVDDLLGDFPFAGPAELANAIALGLEQFARAMIDGPLPLHSFEAPTPGSGKGLLADALLRPSCGRTVGAISQARDDDEWRKRILAALAQGYPAIQIDNANKPIESGALSMALTIPVFTDRVLGSTRMLSVPVRCSWVVTANNPTYSTEMARRTVRTRIDPKVDRPQDREGWRHPELLTWVDDNRGELVWAFCTLIRAWVVAGKPKFKGKALGSFERWSHVIGGIFETVGIPGFLENQSTFYDVADAETAVWRAFVTAWWDTHGDKEVGTADLFPLALQCDGLDLGNSPEGSKSQKIRFGKLLGAQRDRVIVGYRVTPGRKVQRLQQWRLLPTEPVYVVYDSVCSDTPPHTHIREDEIDPGVETYTDIHNIHSSTVSDGDSEPFDDEAVPEAVQ